MTTPIVFDQLPLHCQKCGEAIPTNTDRDLATLCATLRKDEHDLTKDDLKQLKHSHYALLSCPACALAAMPMPEKRTACRDEQIPIDAPAVWIG